MARKQTRISRKILFTWFMLTGLILLFAPAGLSSGLQFSFARLFHHPLKMGRSITLSSQVDSRKGNWVKETEYKQLQNHLDNLNQLVYEQQIKLEKISGLRNRMPLEGASLVLADIITSYTSSSNYEFVINRGSSDGVREGFFALADNSIIGKVYSVDKRTARIRLVTDTRSKLPVQIGGTDVKGLLEGMGNGSAKINFIPADADVKEGQQVYIQKDAGFLDAPIIAGIVTKAVRSQDNPLLLDVTVKAVCEIDELSDLAIIVMNP